MERALDSLQSRRGGGAGRWLPVLALVSAALCVPPVASSQSQVPAPPAQRVFDFDVNLDKRSIGTHRFTVNHQDDGGATIESSASFDVRILGIAAYRYRHRATEQWRGDCLAAIDATTNDNGRSLRVTGLARDGGFQLQQPAPESLPPCVGAYAYWNRNLLLRQRALLNPQTGKLDALRVESLGRETLQWQGQTIVAERYRLHAAQNVIDLWYSLAGDWLRLESTTGSRRLIYRLRSAAGSAAR